MVPAQLRTRRFFRHGPVSTIRPDAWRAQARGVRLGDVRLRQLGLHHGRADRGVQRHFVGGVADGASWAPWLGPARLRLSSLIVMITMPVIGAYADLRRQEALVGVVHVGLRRGHRRPGRRRAGRRGLGADCHRAVQRVLHLWRIADRVFPAGAGARRSHGQRVGLGLELRLPGRNAHALAQPGLRVVGTGTRPAWQPTSSPQPCSSRQGSMAPRSCVTFALLTGAHGPNPTRCRAPGVTASLARLRRTWNEGCLLSPDFSALLACSVAYQAGISVVIALAAVYAEQVLGFKQTKP